MGGVILRVSAATLLKILILKITYPEQSMCVISASLLVLQSHTTVYLIFHTELTVTCRPLCT